MGRAFGSVSKYFRREMIAAGEYRTLNRAIEKCVESRDGDYVWLVEDCDSCAFPIENNAYGYSKIRDGEVVVEVVCGICRLEREG